VPRPNSSELAPKHAFSARPILCYVTERRTLTPLPVKDSLEPILGKIQEVSSAGIDWIQIREKDSSGKSCGSLVREALRRMPAQAGTQGAVTRILVNDRLDVALSERANGVHLGENSMPVAEAKRLVLAAQAAQTIPENFLMGASCHSVETARSAADAGADYVFFGPVFATPSKASFGAPQGLHRLAEVCAAINIPVLAIGGITLENARSCLSAGAAGIAAIRLFQDARETEAVVRALLQTAF
jgi:thiamine-phosphate pyrophosphorylase